MGDDSKEELNGTQQGFCKIRATEYRLKYICNSNRLLYLGRINEKATAKRATGMLMPVLRKAPNVVCNFSFFICYISLLCDEKHQQNIFKAVIHRSIFIQQQQVFQGDLILLGRQKFVNVTSRLQKQKSVHTTRGLAKCLATECVFQLFVYCVSFGPRAT